MIKCSLCDQSFDEGDPLIEIMKERHTLGMHSTNRVIYSERDGSPSKPMGNHIYGHVEWVKIDGTGGE
jgi:hypothetical protein